MDVESEELWSFPSIVKSGVLEDIEQIHMEVSRTTVNLRIASVQIYYCIVVTVTLTFKDLI